MDLFKDAFSLAGIAQKYVFRNLADDVYFANFGKEHEHIYKMKEWSIPGIHSISLGWINKNQKQR